MTNRQDHINYLKHCLQNDLFSLWQQCIVSVDLVTLLGTEILLRLPDPKDLSSKEYQMTIADWVNIAEEEELLEAITYHLIEKITENSHCMRSSLAPYYVNVSPVIINDVFIDRIIGLLSKNRVDYSLIGIELTERQQVQDTALLKRSLERLRTYGISCALDDYDRGYATEHFLQNIAVDRVKIDQDLLHRGMQSKIEELKIISLIAYAKQHQITVIAEGIETYSDYAFARNLGCHGIQGYYLERPIQFL